MAAINGIELKHLKSIHGLEYTGFGANIYMDGKRIGTVVDDGDGGGIFIDIPEKSNQQAFEAIRKTYIEKKGDSTKQGDEIFIYDLKELVMLESTYKKQSKHAKKPIAIVNLEKQILEGCYQSIGAYVTGSATVEKMLDTLKQDGVEFDRVQVYRSLEDFNITMQAEGATA